MSIHFGPAGNSDSFAAAGYRASADAPRWIAGMGLNAYEYQCGHGVSIGQATAATIGARAIENGIQMSLHTPYYINMSSAESERIEKNIGYVLQSCRAIRAMGGKRMVVHCGGVGKLTHVKAFENTKQNVKRILSAMEQEGFSEQIVCLETMGKRSMIGDAAEVFDLVALDERLLPCIDFGHLNARTGGGCNSYEAFAQLLNLMEQKIGIERTHIFHAHFSKIEFSNKGEVRHLTFADQKYGPCFEPLAVLLAERGFEPTIICESAGTQAEDALTMKKLYEGARIK